MSSNKCFVFLAAAFVCASLIAPQPAFAQSKQKQKKVDTQRSVMTDEVYYLIPLDEEEDKKDKKEKEDEEKAKDDTSSSTTQSGSAKGGSSVSAINSSVVMAPPPGGGGGGGSSGPDAYHETYARQNIREDLTAYGTDLLGEQFDLGTGSLSFNQTDIVLPGNSGLEVALRRTVNTAQGVFVPDNEFGDWALDIPKMETMVSSQVSGLWQNDRCTERSDPGDVYWFGNWYYVWEYWNGLKMHIPGSGAQTVVDNPTNPVKSASATKKSTTGYWDISCTTISGASEGFVATSADGIKYTFKQKRYLAATGVEKANKIMSRKRAQMLVTKVEDRFGNRVDYTYTGDNLTKIEATDGRKITMTYNSSDRLTSATANGRTWTYGYTQPSGTSWVFLTSVTLPDGESWSMDLSDLILAEMTPGLYLQCGGTRETATGTVTHPYGAKGTYTITEMAHGRTNVPNLTNLNNPSCTENKHIQRSFDVLSLTQKKLEGKGMPTYTWDYTYSENAGGWAGGSTSPLKTTRVDKPDGTYDIHHFDRSWTYLEGTAVKVQTYTSTGSLLQTIDYNYEVGPSRGYYGEVFYENLAKNVSPKHQTQHKTTRGTDVFTTDYDTETNNALSTFSYGKPIEIDESNSISSVYAKVVDIAYAHDKTNWQVGRETTRKVGTEEISENIYNANNQVSKRQRYNVEVAEFSYNANGTLAWQEDALNNRVTMSNWKRGVPQTVTYPNSTTHTFVVDNNGWITKSTDRKGQFTDYDYDNMGRLERVEYPTNDGINRLDKTLDLIEITSTNDGVSGSGIAIGQWKHVQQRGDLKVTKYLDSMFRPVLTRSQDTGDSSLDRFSRTTFDSNSQSTFQSFPSATVAATSGTDSIYDALGRVTETEENVSPYAKTTSAYLSGNKTRITNPRGKQTTTSYFALGSPAKSTPWRIWQPEGVTTTIGLNKFGEMTFVTQAGGGTTSSRTYRYDAQHRMCRQIDPETGSTAYSYNDAGQLEWYALAASGSIYGCYHGSVPSSQRIVHTYNNMGQLTNVNYPDASPDLSYTYDDNGNVTTLNNFNAYWTYTYNAVDALKTESLQANGQTFALAYGFDTQDRLTSTTYPSGQVVNVTPNAYSEAEAVTGYASNIDMHVNGSIKNLTYGNGRVYSTTQNVRQLPAQLKVMNGGTTIAKFTHLYDPNANITSIDDGVNSSSYDRSMTYDDIDRLKMASGFWGNATYTYDALGNIKTKTESGPTVTYSYNAGTNRLTSISGANAMTFGYDTRGNVTSNGSQTFVYNRAGSMTSSTSPAISYKYDGHKRRVQKTEGSQTSYSVYSSAGTLMHKKVGGASTDYIYAGSMLVAEKTGSTKDYMYTDLLGSPIAGNNGSAYKEHYRPWGDKKDNPIQLADDVGYTGHQSDVATGLTYMQARYYDPVVGRFMAVDPVGFSPSNPMTFNRYSYVNNNPYKYSDPDGRQAEFALELGKDLNRRLEAGHSDGKIAGGIAKESALGFAAGMTIVAPLVAVELLGAEAAMVVAAISSGGEPESLLRTPGGAAGAKTIFRKGVSRESPTRLNIKAKEAERSNIGIHGVSGSKSKSPDCSSASCANLEAAGFKVHDTPTRRDPNHVTIELPKPVMKEDAAKFNEVFRRD